MGEGEPQIRTYTDDEIKDAKAQLAEVGISPIPENIDTYILLKETSQQPAGYEDIYKNINNPEMLQQLMEEKKLKSMMHIEGPNVRSHTKLGLQILEEEHLSGRKHEISKQIFFHHDLGKPKVANNEFNKTQTITTIASGKLFQTMIGHATAALETTKEKLQKNGLTDKEIKLCLQVIENHMQTDLLLRKNPKKIIDLVESFGENEEERKMGVQYLCDTLHIDGLATQSIKLLDDNTLEHSINTKKAEFPFESIREKYLAAQKEQKDIEVKGSNEQEKMDDCDTYLPAIAMMITPETQENENFRENPDDPKEHQPMRHEFGIITHTKKTLEHFFKRNNRLRQTKDKVNKALQETIDGKTKEELMAISIVFHDIGKFLRTFVVKGGKKIISHEGHEKTGKNILLNDNEINILIKDRYDLTEKQLTYITDCIALHYELSKIRDVAKDRQEGYNLAYIRSESFRLECEKIKDAYPKYKTEIGVYFLCDSLAKTDITIYGRDDQEISSKRETAEKIIAEKNLPPTFIEAVMQRPISIATAQKYLSYIFPGESKQPA